MLVLCATSGALLWVEACSAAAADPVSAWHQCRIQRLIETDRATVVFFHLVLLHTLESLDLCFLLDELLLNCQRLGISHRGFYSHH